MKKKLKGYTATYKHPDGEQLCDLEELAKTYISVGKVPERLGWGKACEIALLAEAFLVLNEKYNSEET